MSLTAEPDPRRYTRPAPPDVDEPPGWDPHDDGLTQADRDAEADRAADRYEQHMRGDR